MNFQDIDLKSNHSPGATSRNRPVVRSKFRIKLPFKLLIVSTAVVLLGFSASNWQPTAKAVDSTFKSNRLHYALDLPEASISLEADIQKSLESAAESPWTTVTIQSGDTLASIFDLNGIPAATTYAIATLNDQARSLRQIQPGQKIHLLFDDQNQLSRMKYEADITKTLLIQRGEDQSFSSQIINSQLDAYPVYREGIIESSLFEAAAESNIPESVIMDLAGIFGWDIDFSLDIRQGDRFGIVYNELYKDDVKIRNGRILAAEFVNNGKTYRAVYYTDPKGDGDYFDESGKSMRKAFLRSPVKFARVSSRFSNKRWHPVLSKWRSHKGVDYAAKRGTPIRASGDGKVSFVGTKGGYGRTILIRHGGRYTTLYGHMNGYARGIRTGTKVKQGQIIGYVGSSGLATGPHLHYEFRVNGTHRNPLTVKLPEAKPVHPSYLKHFKEKTSVYLSMLQLMETTVAANTN